MKTDSFENLRQFFEKVKSVGFLERIFLWKHTITLSYDAYEEFKSIDKEMTAQSKKLEAATQEVKDLKKDLEHITDLQKKAETDLTITKKDVDRNNKELQQKEKELGKLKETESQNTTRIAELEAEIGTLNEKKDELTKEKISYEKKLTSYEKEEDRKREEYEHKVTELNSLKNQLDNDRLRVQQEREQEIKDRMENMKKTWRRHEDSVEEAIINICNRQHIEHIDKEKVPFKGKPDNTLKICNEYIIFDAKSPQGDDLENFNTYLKNQAEAAKKYAKQAEVKKQIFLVVPFNTVEKIQDFYYDMADYCIYIITKDSLEPIILSLKKIEEYDFAEQLSPEDREQICRVIGKFAHATKRRIQVDSYFCNEFVNLLNDCSVLPDDILTKSIEFEKADKMNPPLERRAKAISKKELERSAKHIKQVAEAHEINTEAGEVIATIPLYRKEE